WGCLDAAARGSPASGGGLLKASWTEARQRADGMSRLYEEPCQKTPAWNRLRDLSAPAQSAIVARPQILGTTEETLNRPLFQQPMGEGMNAWQLRLALGMAALAGTQAFAQEPKVTPATATKCPDQVAAIATCYEDRDANDAYVLATMP